MATKNYKGAKFNPSKYDNALDSNSDNHYSKTIAKNWDQAQDNLGRYQEEFDYRYGLSSKAPRERKDTRGDLFQSTFDNAQYGIPTTSLDVKANIPEVPTKSGLEAYKEKMNKARGDKFPSFLKPLYDKVLDPVAYGIDKTLYGNPLTQRTMVKAGETLAGKGSMMDYDGTKLEAKDAGKIGNFLADSAGTLAGMAVTPTGGGNSLLNATDDIGLKAGEFVSKKLPSKLNPTLSKVVPSMARGAVDNGLGDMAFSIRDGKSLGDTLKAGGTGALGGAVLFGAGKGIGEGLSNVKGIKKPSLELPTTKPTIEVKKPVVANMGKIEPNIPTLPKINPYENKKFAVKNTKLDNAYKEYDEAITAIQNYVGHWKLEPGELEKASKDLGIDLNSIIKKMEDSQVNPTNIKGASEKSMLARSAGVNTQPLPKLYEPLPKAMKDINIMPQVKEANMSVAPSKKPSLPQFEKINSEVAATTNKIVDSNGIERSTQKVVSSSKDKSNFSNKLNNFYTRTVDSNNPLKPIGDKTYTLATNSKNVGGTIDYIFKDGLVDKNGKKVGASLKELVEDIPKGEEKDFWEYALQRHNIARATEGKNVYMDFTPEQSLEAVKKWESLNPEWKNKADNFTNWIDTFMNEWGIKSGLTDAEIYKGLREKYPNYLPTQRDFTDLEGGLSFINGKGFVGQRTPLKKATGSERDIIDPVENIMELVNRTVRTAKYNEVGQSLVEAIQRNPNEMMKYAEIIDESQVNPNLNNIVSVLQGGKPTHLMINDKSLLKSLEGLYKNSPNDVEKIAKKLTGTFKSLVTQKNPVFAVRNIMRDVPTAYIYGNEANPIKFGADLFKAGKDLLTNSEVAQQYKALGGGGSNFFNSGNVAKSAKELTKTSPLQKIGNVIETINNTTESAPRLAEFKRTLKKTGDPQKALFDAADVTTNFSRGGDITKTLDSGVPYLNAGVQGLDKLVRQVKNKPLQTIGKATVAITAPTVALNLINKDNPAYQELDNRTKDNYFLIPKDDGTFVKIPKSRELGALFSSLFERIQRQSSGDKNAFKGYGKTLATSFAPANPIESNIISPYLGLRANKDFADRAIVPQSMENLSPKYQYDEKTSEIAKKIGETANISPKQIDYLIKSYTGVIGQLGLPAATKSNYNGNTTKNLLKPITTQFTADPLYSNQSLTDFYDNYDMLQTKAADKNFTSKLPSKVVTREEELKNKFAKASKEISGLNKEIKMSEGNEEKIRRLRLQMIRKARESNQIIR